MAKSTRLKQVPVVEPKVRVIETFRHLSSYDVSNLIWNQPTCFNGVVSLKRYRVTIEEIEEGDDVIRERIQKLWDENNSNHHHRATLLAVAKRYGMTLA